MSDTPAQIQFDDFAKLDLRIATIQQAEPHPNADKLMVLQLDVGGEPRQILAGIRAFYQPEELVGKQIVIVANLAPRTMRGLESQGMLLAASTDDHSALTLIGPHAEIASGSSVS